MKTIALIASILVCLTACHRGTNTALKTLTVDADSVAINYFRGDGSVDTVVAVKILRDKNDINQLVNFITENSTSAKANCGYDGTIHFFRQDSVVQDIYFRMNDANCMLFSFRNGEKWNMASTILSGEAKAFLQAIKSK
ncbi:MAG TPA: hypothetical protein VK559_11550 [Ferruginibacter sp.]|nr:hypothetical protein [Ferruginibacter sp.]